jgi:dephospho-CoA kinase
MTIVANNLAKSAERSAHAKIPVIGLIGGMGSGKSRVAQELARRGGRIVAGDPLGHEALRDPVIIGQLVARWGRAILDAGGNVDRPRVSSIVFADPLERQALEAIVHPYIERRLREELDLASHDPSCPFVILDAAILLEAGWQRFCSIVVFVDAPRAQRLARLARFRGWSEEELAKRERAQLNLDEKKTRADFVLDNSGAESELPGQIDKLLQTAVNRGRLAAAAEGPL